MPPKRIPTMRPCPMLAAFWRDFRRPQPDKQQAQEGAVHPAPTPALPEIPAPNRQIIEPNEAAPSSSSPPSTAPAPVSVSSTSVSSVSGSSDSDQPVSRKARKLVMRKMQKRSDAFAYAMIHGQFPLPGPAPQQPPPEHAFLADPCYLWNAVPPRSCQYLDMEAAHEGPGSEGSTGSSEGSLSDPDFIVQDLPHENRSEEDLLVLQRMFPKTFKRNLADAPKRCKQPRRPE